MADLRRWVAHWFTPRSREAPEWARAKALIAAIDAGGLPLNPAKVNDIARKLGLEVSSRASQEDTIARIRAALAYRKSHQTD